MVAVELPDADCGHVTLLRQHCGRCLRWCCSACYSPWMALACTACRTAAAVAPIPVIDVSDALTGHPEAEQSAAPAWRARAVRDSGGCRSGPPGRRGRSEVRLLTLRIADLERQLEDMNRA